MVNIINYPEQYYRHVKVTPLVPYRGTTTWNNIWLKDETQQVAHSFKFRGTFHRLLQEPAGTTVVTASTGNHAMGVAVAASKLGLHSRVIVPNHISKVKAEAIASLGAQLTSIEGNYDDCVQEALRLSAETGMPYISSLDDPLVVQGHSSLFQEISEQLPTGFDAIFVPVGGGGLLSGCLLHLQGTGIKVVGAELAAVPSMQHALATGERLLFPSTKSIGEGMLVRQAGKLPFELARAYAPLEMVQVSEEQLREGVRLLWQRNAIRAEASGAASLAAALAYTAAHPDQQVAVAISGGNIDETLFQHIIAEEPGVLR